MIYQYKMQIIELEIKVGLKSLLGILTNYIFLWQMIDLEKKKKIEKIFFFNYY